MCIRDRCIFVHLLQRVIVRGAVQKWWMCVICVMYVFLCNFQFGGGECDRNYDMIAHVLTELLKRLAYLIFTLNSTQ